MSGWSERDLATIRAADEIIIARIAVIARLVWPCRYRRWPNVNTPLRFWLRVSCVAAYGYRAHGCE
jgi:hypothetical protein